MNEQSLAFDFAQWLIVPPGAGTSERLAQLGGACRAITTSLLGYGSTPDTRPDGNATTQTTDDRHRPHGRPRMLGTVADRTAHALAAARPGALLVEANPLGLLRAAGDLRHYAMFEAVTAPYFAAFERGDVEAARGVIDFYGGAGSFDAMPPKVRAYVVATTPVNVRDWSSGTPFEPSPQALRAIGVPTTVVRGGSTHPAMSQIAELLHASMPGSRFVTIDGGGHFLPSTHAAQVATLVRRQVEAAASA
ncbi:MAG: alpha/beta hydrolase [Ideonella sp.]|nr:alpha/beta hydrolase [Ideonella sp.]